MRQLAMYLRQVFCKHDWDISEKAMRLTRTQNSTGIKEFEDFTQVYMRCKKCGYHQRHKKFGF